MYCSTCGSALAQGLSYCNHCGARSDAAAGDAAYRPRPEPLVAAIAFVFVFGLGALIGLMAVMKYFGFNDGVTNGFTVMVFMLMVAVEAVFTWMLVSGRRAAEGGRGAARLKEQTTQELEGAGARSLPDPAPSVTEHATRTFEPLHRERGSK